MQSIYTAATGMQASEVHIDVIANNLANQNTTAFKKESAQFEDLLYIQTLRVGAETSDTGTIRPTGAQIGMGVALAAVYRNNEQGSMQNTGNTFDLAIDGAGFFRVIRPDGAEVFTRAGAFQVNNAGIIVTSDGFQVSPSVTIPSNATDISINESGEIIATIAGQVTTSNLGQFDLVSFINPSGLQAIGNNFFQETGASGAPVDGTPNADGFGRILQGFLEGSNVNSVTELTDLIKAQRAFELNLKVLEKSDENAQSLNQSA